MRLISFDFTFDKNHGAEVPTKIHVKYYVTNVSDRTQWMLEVTAAYSVGTKMVSIPNVPPGTTVPQTIKKVDWGPDIPIGPILDIPANTPVDSYGEHTFECVLSRQSMTVPVLSDFYSMTVRLVPTTSPSNEKQFALNDVNL